MRTMTFVLIAITASGIVAQAQQADSAAIKPGHLPRLGGRFSLTLSSGVTLSGRVDSCFNDTIRIKNQWGYQYVRHGDIRTVAWRERRQGVPSKYFLSLFAGTIMIFDGQRRLDEGPSPDDLLGFDELFARLELYVGAFSAGASAILLMVPRYDTRFLTADQFWQAMNRRSAARFASSRLRVTLACF